ncbi:hypothetical protein G9272_16845 [Streptomyces asoensis]|uniref:Uncharacterized protein n=1 Tax=Streptomyces asoensis TaxID=249586 RepID=A0A6M4WPI2_9ACTN|nr:hypothetical protein [Streptomyces asoensis]QJT01772.1 hypothetical protein G9272_16845 [Streptomyces asoensis]
MPTTATGNLFTVIRHWPDLTEALGAKSAPTWPPAGRMSDFVRDLEQRDAEQLATERQRSAELRALERDPGQIGERPIPIRLTVHETMTTVQGDLVECADQVAAAVQRHVIGQLPKGYPLTARQRRELEIMRDRRDPRRWSWTKTRPDAPYAALWLLARVQGAPGPFRPLDVRQLDQVSAVARQAARMVEAALDLGEGRAYLARPCPLCGGRLAMYGGAGAVPVARCGTCGHVWGGSKLTAPA